MLQHSPHHNAIGAFTLSRRSSQLEWDSAPKTTTMVKTLRRKYSFASLKEWCSLFVSWSSGQKIEILKHLELCSTEKRNTEVYYNQKVSLRFVTGKHCPCVHTFLIPRAGSQPPPPPSRFSNSIILGHSAKPAIEKNSGKSSTNISTAHMYALQICLFRLSQALIEMHKSFSL